MEYVENILGRNCQFQSDRSPSRERSAMRISLVLVPVVTLVKIIFPTSISTCIKKCLHSLLFWGTRWERVSQFIWTYCTGIFASPSHTWCVIAREDSCLYRAAISLTKVHPQTTDGPRRLTFAWETTNLSSMVVCFNLPPHNSVLASLPIKSERLELLPKSCGRCSRRFVERADWFPSLSNSTL
jgi:hypothetical protein